MEKGSRQKEKRKDEENVMHNGSRRKCVRLEDKQNFNMAREEKEVKWGIWKGTRKGIREGKI